MARLISRDKAAQLLDVNPQTISNWVDKGIIKGHIVNRFLMIDHESIVRNFDSLTDLDVMERRIALRKSELRELESTMNKKLKDYRDASFLFGCELSPLLLRSIFNALLTVAGEDLLEERESKILESLLSTKAVERICEETSLTYSRIIQIARRGIHKISTLRSYSQIHKEYKNLKKENLSLHNYIQFLEGEYKEKLEKMSVDSSLKDRKILYSFKQALSHPIEVKKLSRRCKHCLERAGIETIGDLVTRPKRDIVKMRNVGRVVMCELDNYINDLGLFWSLSTDYLDDSFMKSWLSRHGDLIVQETKI